MTKQTSHAQGGPPPLGAPTHLLEIGVGRGQRYDPDRDILEFWKYIMSGIVAAFHKRTLPVLEEFDLNPKLERRVGVSLLALIEAFEKKVDTYDELITNWYAGCDDTEAADFVMKIIGRACLQFYVECALARGMHPDQVWPLGMDNVINDIVASPKFKRPGLSKWLKLKRLAVNAADLLGF